MIPSRTQGRSPLLKYYRVAKKIVRRQKKTFQIKRVMDDLKDFLQAADLIHLYEHLNEQGMELKYLLLANDSDLSELVHRMVDKIKLRNAIETYRKLETDSATPSITTKLSTSSQESLDKSFGQSEPNTIPTITTDAKPCDANIASLIFEDSRETRESSPSSNQITTSATPLIVVENSLTKWAEEEWEFVQEIGPLEDKKPLKDLLQHTTLGKTLLKKEGHSLTPKERKFLVQLIVEHQLHTLPSVEDTIRQEVWSNWAQEICSLFKGEQADVYYVPYRVTERQALPASGLLHNRLITHRRVIRQGDSCKRKSSCSSSTSSEHSHETGSKRVRPLPSTIIDTEETKENVDQCLEWLEVSTSPFDVVESKWRITFKTRHDILKQISIYDYFKQFPCLRLPTGHQLLVADFENTYPLATATFEENFPIIKKRLLELLVEKGLNIRAEGAVTDLLELATVGEQQGSIAALKCIPYLLKQVAPLPKKIKGKKWKPARSEVSEAFICHVTSPDNVERCINDRVKVTQDKNISLGPFIVAVGPSWSNITQFEVVVTKDIRYQFTDIKEALTTAFKIYFSLDCEYAADAAPCWMLVQRAMFKIVTKFDVLYDKSVTLRELIKDCQRSS